MSLITLAGRDIISACLTIPRLGRPTLTGLVSGTELLPTGPLVLQLETGETWQFTVQESENDGSDLKIYAVGGKDKLQTVLSKRQYRGVSLGLIISDLIKESGETLGTISGDLPVQDWIRRESTAINALDEALALNPALVWRIDSQGRVNISDDQYPAISQPLDVLQACPEEGYYKVLLSLTTNPGTTIDGIVGGVRKTLGKIYRVVHHFSDYESYTEVFTHPKTVTNRYLDAIIKVTQPVNLDYSALYPCQVLNDNGDMTLDIRPDNPALPDMQAIPLRRPVAGLECEVMAGSRILLGFDSASPSKPYCGLWEAGELVSLKLTVGDAITEVTTSSTTVIVGGSSVEITSSGVTINTVAAEINASTAEINAASTVITSANIQLGSAAAVIPVALLPVPSGPPIPSTVIKGI